MMFVYKYMKVCSKQNKNLKRTVQVEKRLKRTNRVNIKKHFAKKQILKACFKIYPNRITLSYLPIEKVTQIVVERN